MWQRLLAKLVGRPSAALRPLGFAADPARAWAVYGEHLLDEHDGLPVVVARLRPVQAEVALTHLPEHTVEDELRTAFDVACVDPNHPYVRLFLDRSVALAAEVDRHADRWDERWRTGSGQRAGFLVAKALTEAWQRDDDLDASLLSRAAEEAFRVTGSQWHGHEWMQQSLYFEAVQCLLLAGAAEEARAALKTRKRFGATRRYFEWMQQITEPGLDQPQRIARFDELFDLVRHPRFSPLGGERAQRIEELSRGVPSSFTQARLQWQFSADPCLRLRLAALRWRWAQGSSARGSWRQVIGQVSAPAR
jgi:hypothetical protein